MGLVFFTRSSRELSEPTCSNRARKDFNPIVHSCWGRNIPEPAGDRSSWSHPLHGKLTENSSPRKVPTEALGLNKYAFVDPMSSRNSRGLGIGLTAFRTSLGWKQGPASPHEVSYSRSHCLRLAHMESDPEGPFGSRSTTDGPSFLIPNSNSRPGSLTKPGHPFKWQSRGHSPNPGPFRCSQGDMAQS